jgi:NAD-dependent dihydropyrimidine dehydrogenase PreA subunit
MNDKGEGLKTDLFYYTGTGNSLWAARTLGRELGGVSIRSISRMGDNPIESHADAVGLIFPVHIWGLPRRVIAFVNTLVQDTSKYCFAIAVNAGQVAATLLQLQKLLGNSRGLFLSSGFNIVMPSNYIPWGGPGPLEQRMKRIDTASRKLTVNAPVIAKAEQKPVERGPLWQNILFSMIYRISYPYVPTMDKSFWVDEKCNSCGICHLVCPCANIELIDGKPSWLHHCEQCLACIHWCPKEAIQYGKRTPRYERYRHPEIKLGDVMTTSAP